MPSAQCPHCGSTEIDHDPSRGDVVCMQCGSVLEESVIVSEVQYAQDSSGTSRAVGQLVRAEGSVPSGFNIGHSYGAGKESRLITLQNAKKKISNLAAHLKLPERFVDIAHNFYRMALMQKLTQGRKNAHVIAACVYMVCRKEETHHMLLDLSDVLQVNVYEIGKTYLKLSNALCINTPAIDPSLYILRFAHQLEFGDKTHEVSVTAARLIQRMKRDWMHTGRRPSGLCGAALLVAARLHNFNRSVDEIIKVVKVCQATVRKRLTEFSDTPSSRLTLDEFMTIDLEEEQDPPAFKASRKKKSSELDNEAKVQEATKQIAEFQDIIEKSLEKARAKKFAKYNKLMKEGETGDSNDGTLTEEFIVHDAIQAINEVLHTEQVEVENETSSQLQKLLSSSQESSDSGFSSSFASNVSGNDLTQNSATARNDQLDITGLDDAEIDFYIMDDDETKSKTEFWFKTNEDFLQEQKEKEERRIKEEAENANKEQKKKRKRTKTKFQANTTEEAVKQMLQQKKISLKLDYTVLENLNSGTAATNDIKESPAPEPEPSEPRPPKRIRPSRSKPLGPLPSSIRQGISDLIGRSSEDSIPKVTNEEKEEVAPMEEPAPEVVVVEDTVVPNTAEENIEEDVEEDEEEDEHVLSVAELLSQHRGEEGDGDYCDYDYETYDD